MDITLDKPVTITLQPESVKVIIVALNEIPRKHSEPVIQELLAQLNASPGTDVEHQP